VEKEGFLEIPFPTGEPNAIYLNMKLLTAKQ
jgi:hypothetical protein